MRVDKCQSWMFALCLLMGACTLVVSCFSFLYAIPSGKIILQIDRGSFVLLHQSENGEWAIADNEFYVKLSQPRISFELGFTRQPKYKGNFYVKVASGYFGLLALTLVLISSFFPMIQRRVRKRCGLCRGCKYPVLNLQVCPECGART